MPTDVGPAARPPGPLAEIEVGDDAVDWASLGFSVTGDTAMVGSVRLRFAGRHDERGRGVVGWTLRGLAAPAGDVDGLATDYEPTAEPSGQRQPHAAGDTTPAAPSGAPVPAAATHPSTPTDPASGATPGVGGHANGVTHIDHVVVLTPDLDRTTAALATVGLEPRRTREAGGGRRQRFFRLGEVVLEVVGPAEPAGDAAATFWGLAFTVADIDAAARLLAGRVGEPRHAVQQGRRIATLRTGPEISVPVALMSPAPESPLHSGR